MPVQTANFYHINHSPYSVKTIGMLGGGQLGLMLAAAALPLGIRTVFLEDSLRFLYGIYRVHLQTQPF